MVSPEIETLVQVAKNFPLLVVARERWSRLRLKPVMLVSMETDTGVARERWSRLRLKPTKQIVSLFPSQGGKGAVVSPEIETMMPPLP